MRSQNLYKKLQKQYSRKINLDLKRINIALKKLGYVQEKIKNPINIIGSDGKYSTLKSLQYFIQEDKKIKKYLKINLEDILIVHDELDLPVGKLKLKDSGVLILDDSNRPDYAPGFELAAELGYRTLHFEGLKPTDFIREKATLFYRSNNCFGI